MGRPDPRVGHDIAAAAGELRPAAAADPIEPARVGREPPVNDVKTPSRMFLGIAVFMAVIGTVYWFASYEPAGTTMLGLAAALSALCAIYLRVQSEAETADRIEHDHYLPHTSVWPF